MSSDWASWLIASMVPAAKSALPYGSSPLNQPFPSSQIAFSIRPPTLATDSSLFLLGMNAFGFALGGLTLK